MLFAAVVDRVVSDVLNFAHRPFEVRAATHFERFAEHFARVVVCCLFWLRVVWIGGVLLAHIREKSRAHANRVFAGKSEREPRIHHNVIGIRPE